jgi:hypothetical protein
MRRKSPAAALAGVKPAPFDLSEIRNGGQNASQETRGWLRR